MKIPFCDHHLLIAINEFENQTLPLDSFLSDYFRSHKAVGAKDRKFIAETIYGMIRWKGLLDYLSGSEITWEKRLDLYRLNKQHNYLKDETIPLHIRLSFPEPLFDLIVNSHGIEKAISLCNICNFPAPTTIRVNSLKTSRDALLNKWKEVFDIIPSEKASHGIQFLKKINFFALEEFKQGFFEVQDEGSQLLADLVQAAPGDLVMDYCAGSGGKTLAFAPRMQGKGQIFLHDIRPFILQESKKRLRRAGIENAQIALPDDAKLKKLKKKMDWVLVDAPCSGTGTLRRNPDMKWRFSVEAFEKLVGLQRSIFEKALSYLAPEGKIVYATCSFLKEENELQVEHFLKTYSLELIQQPFQTLPTENGCDGFFGAVLKRKTNTIEAL